MHANLTQRPEDLDAARMLASLCNGMRGFWRDIGRTRAGLTYLPWGVEAAEQVAEATGERGDQLRAANIALYHGDLLGNVGRLSEAEQAYERDLALRRRLHDRQGEGVVLSNLGELARQRGQLAQAEGYYQQALAIMREVQARREEGVVLFNLLTLA